ncbi:MAG: nucleotide exchange factor GrpE [Bacteroidales bacterium]|nr:nucleotide exchange factor GrpE [Bacteroidales bacterium]
MSEENKEQQKEEIKDTQATAANQEPSAQNADSSEKPETEQRQSRRERRKHREHHDDNEQKVQELGQKLIEANDKYVRIYSEYENYRKRTTMEKADLILNGAKDTIKAILPVVDDFERALAHIADDDASKEGVQLIYNKMMKVLEQRGLKPMEAKGQKFDENLHEAVTQFPAADESQKGMVVDVVEKGYYLNDKVLRYAKVVVAI